MEIQFFGIYCLNSLIAKGRGADFSLKYLHSCQASYTQGPHCQSEIVLQTTEGPKGEEATPSCKHMGSMNYIGMSVSLYRYVSLSAGH